jgi:two-component system response regulator MprA
LLCDKSGAEKESGVVGHRLLIVDDDAGVQKMLKILLEFERLEVMLASDGLEALECVEHARPDLILLDLMMPRMDGRAFIEELRRRGLRPSLPVIVLTADIHAKPLIEHMGVEDWLVKPFHLSDLLGKIRRYLSKDAGDSSSKQS